MIYLSNLILSIASKIKSKFSNLYFIKSPQLRHTIYLLDKFNISFCLLLNYLQLVLNMSRKVLQINLKLTETMLIRQKLTISVIFE